MDQERADMISDDMKYLYKQVIANKMCVYGSWHIHSVIGIVQFHLYTTQYRQYDWVDTYYYRLNADNKIEYSGDMVTYCDYPELDWEESRYEATDYEFYENSEDWNWKH
jgi:hypothetical protein